MKTQKVHYDNVRTVELGGVEFKLKSCLGAGIVYANQFADKDTLEKPYKGIFADDMLEVWRKAQVKTEPVTDEKGNVVKDEDGNEVKRVIRKGHVDLEALVRIMWAMCVSAGGTKESYEKFQKRVYDLPVSMMEEASLYATVVLDLGAGITFRVPAGQGGTGEPDEAQEGQS